MLKTVLMATSMLVAAPVFAQDAKPTTPPAHSAPTTASDTAPVADDAAPDATTEIETAAAPQATPAPAGQTAPAQAAAQPAPATPGQPAAAATAAAQPAPATQPAATQDQVALAVGRDFATYDKDADGALSAAEFGSWMGTLRKASEPSFAPDSPEAKTWASQAFTSADADKSASINKQELTAFLTPKPS